MPLVTLVTNIGEITWLRATFVAYIGPPGIHVIREVRQGFRHRLPLELGLSSQKSRRISCGERKSGVWGHLYWCLGSNRRGGVRAFG